MHCGSVQGPKDWSLHLVAWSSCSSLLAPHRSPCPKLYQMERYADSIKVFLEAVEKTEPAKLGTLLTNLTAAQLKAKSFEGVLEVAAKYLPEVKRTYDLAFNVACTHIERHDYAKAAEFLQVARGLPHPFLSPRFPDIRQLLFKPRPPL